MEPSTSAHIPLARLTHMAGEAECHLVVIPREGRSRLGDQLARLCHRAFLWDWYVEVEVLNWGHVSLEHKQPSFLDAEGKCDLLEEK